MKTLYLITGAAGHVGSALCAELHARGQRVRALALPGEDVTFLRQTGAEVLFGDVTKPATLEPFFDIPEGVSGILIHCAAVVDIAGGENPAVRAVNVDGTRNVMEFCLDRHIKKAVYVCSVHAMPPLAAGRVRREVDSYDPAPLDGAYARSKAAAADLVQRMIRDCGLPAVIVLPSGIIGPYCGKGNHLVQMVKDYCRGALPAVVRGGYDFVDVRDVANGILAAAEKGRVGESYLLTGHAHTLKEMTAMLAEITGGRKPGVIPMWMGHLAVPFAEHAAKRKLYQSKYTAVLANRAAEEPTELVSIAGKCCESGDLIGTDFNLPAARTGDILAVLSTGAYNYSMASNYNRNFIPPAVLVKDGKADYIVRPQSYEDLVRNDVIPDRLK